MSVSHSLVLETVVARTSNTLPKKRDSRRTWHWYPYGLKCVKNNEKANHISDYCKSNYWTNAVPVFIVMIDSNIFQQQLLKRF